MSALNETLKDGWSQPSGSALGRLRSALVVSEIAIAALLLVGSGLLLRSFARVLAVDPGFHAENVLTMDISLPSSKYKTDPQIVAFYDNLIGRIRALPGTLSAGAIINLPLGDGGMNGDFQIQGRTFPLHQEPIAEKCIVTPDYFRAMGVRLLRGRVVHRTRRPRLAYRGHHQRVPGAPFLAQSGSHRPASGYRTWRERRTGRRSSAWWRM